MDAEAEVVVDVVVSDGSDEEEGRGQGGRCWWYSFCGSSRSLLNAYLPLPYYVFI